MSSAKKHTKPTKGKPNSTTKPATKEANPTQKASISATLKGGLQKLDIKGWLHKRGRLKEPRQRRSKLGRVLSYILIATGLLMAFWWAAAIAVKVNLAEVEGLSFSRSQFVGSVLPYGITLEDVALVAKSPDGDSDGDSYRDSDGDSDRDSDSDSHREDSNGDLDDISDGEYSKAAIKAPQVVVRLAGLKVVAEFPKGLAVDDAMVSKARAVIHNKHKASLWLQNPAIAELAEKGVVARSICLSIGDVAMDASCEGEVISGQGSSGQGPSGQGAASFAEVSKNLPKPSANHPIRAVIVSDLGTARVQWREDPPIKSPRCPKGSCVALILANVLEDSCPLLYRWSKQGGVVELDEITVVAAGERVSLKGTFALDSKNQPLAVVDFSVEQLAGLMEVYQKFAGKLHPAVVLAVGFMQKGGEKQLSATLQNGKVSIAGIRLGKVDKLPAPCI